MSDITLWKNSFISDTLQAIDKKQILTWYEQSEDQTLNPGRFIGLSEQTKRRFEFINKHLIEVGINDIVKIKDIMNNIKLYFNTIDDTNQKYELVLFDLINEVYRLANNNNITNFKPIFDIKNQFPKFEAHFKKEKLDSLNFNAFFRNPTNTYSTIGFICSFRQIITKDVIEKLDKAAEIDDTNKSASSSFSYQSELEICYLSIIIKMIVFSYKDPELASIVDTSINNWLNNYPFRILNGKGDFTPDNFFLSANSYIRSEYNLNKRLNSYYAFFNKLKNTRTPPKVTINSCIDFLDLYDGNNTYEQIDWIDKPEKSMRSIYFRDDFDYLNSLLFRGINLNRNFWIDLDKKVEEKNKKLGTYLLLLANAKGIDEFYETIINELELKNAFIQDMADKMKRYNKICETSDEDLKNILNNFGTEEEPNIKPTPEYLDIEVLKKSDYKDYFNKNVAFLSKEIILKIDDKKYMYYTDFSNFSKIILNNDNITKRAYNYCLGDNECNIVKYDGLRLNINTDEKIIKEPIHKFVYSNKILNNATLTKLLKDVVLRKIHIYWLKFTVEKLLPDGTTLIVKTMFDVVNADPSAIKKIYKEFTLHDDFFLISIEYGKLSDETKSITKPKIREDTYNERMMKLNERIFKLENETIVKYKQEINNIDILGQQQVNIQKQLYFNTQKMELGANQTQLAEIDKAKADNKAALDKIVAENNENKARAEALLKEAQAKLTRLIEVGESIKAQREAARAKRAAELEKEILQKQAEAEERAVIDALFNQIKENNNDIKREIRQVNKSKTYFNIVKDKFETIYNQVIKYKQDALITEKEEFDKAVEKLTGEFNSVENSTESLDKKYIDLINMKKEHKIDKEKLNKESNDLIFEQETIKGISNLLEDIIVENTDIIKKVTDVAAKILDSDEIKNIIKGMLNESQPKVQRSQRKKACPKNYKKLSTQGFCEKE
jgi:hypothetical protein